MKGKSSLLMSRRKVWNGFFLILSVAAAVFGIFWLTLILGELLIKGFGGLSPRLFTEITPVPGDEGGLANAIAGSLFMSIAAVLLGTPIGLLAGTYLAEYGRHSWLAVVIRFVNDILLSTPSILTGLFIYEILVVPAQHFSGWAGIAALGVIVVPVVVRTTENMLLLVPNGLREAAAALGAPRSNVIRTVTWRAARAGIVTGVLLAIARISGETAPLLFTALGNNNWSLDPNQAMAALPLVIFNFANSAYEIQHQLAWAGALLITATVLSLSIIARLLQPKRS
ncbi:MAG TPA: phosphate ABC transporter permease PstA [Rhizomicrobium sp.]